MTKLVTASSPAECIGESRKLSGAIGLLETISTMVLRGSIDTDGALHDTEGSFLLPFEGTNDEGQSGYLWLPNTYSVNRGTEIEAGTNQDPTFSYIALQQGIFGFQRSALNIYSSGPDVMIAAVPARRLPLYEFLNRKSWIGKAATAGQVAVIRNGEIIGDDGRHGTFKPEVTNMFVNTARAALTVAVSHSTINVEYQKMVGRPLI